MYISIGNEDNIVYDPYTNNIPLINFAYENLDKIKAIIKEALEVK
ncbi:hypothetical protein [Brachyspira hyodysenteriae]|nr:hypothetical protein [Brachyspira hyodysenteriae]MCZ9850193.1 hypothetical protein [Brachyspira hyodysenteriae]MCZ9878163.1 hypothetical protein [Brachyspira hyodysenteriae]MCZ9894612.1 hypothetical protein [Brachyspira hyodysenteriae]MCZ9898343.1 hypothetical protein [Brachyspira hyodysenteriae]MCZ9951837.1 hypothetical protein [Brachyspira hyodysenteriae]